MPKTIRQALVGLICLLTLLAAALRAPSPAGSRSCAAAPSASDEESSARDHVERVLGRVPIARPAPPPVQRGSARARDMSVEQLALRAELTTSACGHEALAVRGCSTSGVWSAGARTRAELMVFLI